MAHVPDVWDHHKHRDSYCTFDNGHLNLNAVARQTKHGGQTKLTITGSHAGREYARTLLTRLALFLQGIKDIAEQLSKEQRWLMILKQAFSKYLGGWTERSYQLPMADPV